MCFDSIAMRWPPLCFGLPVLIVAVGYDAQTREVIVVCVFLEKSRRDFDCLTKKLGDSLIQQLSISCGHMFAIAIYVQITNKYHHFFFFSVVFQIREAFYGQGHALVAPSLQMQAHLEFTAGNKEDASALLKECLALQEDRYGMDVGWM